MEITPHADGGATVRLTRQELTAYYNLLNQWLAEPLTWSDGTAVPAEVTRAQQLQLHQLAVALGRHDIPHPDS